MKNFAKISLMMAGILLAIGCVLGLIGGIASDWKLTAAVKEDEYWNRKMETWMDKAESAVDHMSGGRWRYKLNSDADGTSVNEEAVDTGESPERGSGKGTWYQVEAARITELEMEAGAGTFIIEEKETEDEMIDIYVEGRGGFDYKAKGAVLHIEGFTGIKVLTGNVINENIIVVSVPKNSYFSKVDVTVGAGDMKLQNLKAGKLEAEVGAGNLGVYYAEADKLSADIGMGGMDVSEMQVRDAEINVGMGYCTYDGSITGNLEAECDMGSIELTLDGSEKDHNYEIECAMGSIDVGSSSFAAIGAERWINNNAASKFDIECNMGSIMINFKN